MKKIKSVKNLSGGVIELFEKEGTYLVKFEFPGGSAKGRYFIEKDVKEILSFTNGKKVELEFVNIPENIAKIYTEDFLLEEA